MDPIGLTASLTTTKEGLPNPLAIEKSLKRTGQQFSLRGIEVVAEGVITRSGERWQLLVPGEKPLGLMQLTEKVQWDAKNKKSAEIAASEASAYTRLGEEAVARRERLRIVGPLRRGDAGEVMLEVRDFSWIKVQKPRSRVNVAKTRR